MATTPHLGITLVESSQAQKEVTVNEALVRLDALINAGVEDKDLATPPVSPAAGALYIVAATATGAWLGQEKKIAFFDQIWRFITPREGLTLWVNDEDLRYSFNGTNWVPLDTGSLANLTGLGIGATPDATNKLVVKSSAALFDAPTNSVQIKVNKTAPANTASYLFQTAYSGRAEFGLVGDDHFSLKVSPDGSTFTQALVVDKTTGGFDVKQQFSASGSTFRKLRLLRPGQLRPAVTAGCADVTLRALGAGFPDIATLDFDPAIQEAAQIAIPMPRNWNEGVLTAQFLWSHGTASGSYGVVWQISGLACGDGDLMAASFGAAVAVSDTGGVADKLYASPLTAAITVAGPAAEDDTLFLKVERKAADAGDTLAVDARLVAVRLFYTQAGFGDE